MKKNQIGIQAQTQTKRTTRKITEAKVRQGERKPWFAGYPHGVDTLDGIGYTARYEPGECRERCEGRKGFVFAIDHYHAVEAPDINDTVRAIGEGPHKHEFKPSHKDRNRPYVVLRCVWCGAERKGPRWRDARMVRIVRETDSEPDIPIKLNPPKDWGEVSDYM